MMDQTGKTLAAPAGSSLEQLKGYTKVVADTGDFASIRSFAPVDATTNPTLILKAVQMEEYEYLLERAVAESEGAGLEGAALVGRTALRLLTLFGGEILKIIPGRVSTEVDARLSFDTAATVAQARELIALYAADGVPKERVLIKVAATWEGIKAAEVLEKEGIHCNLTLLFSMPQAVACAEAGATLISPFVGRILDWYKANTGRDYNGAEDPGVQSVQCIYNYYKHFGYTTEVMGASFRNTGEIVELAGCDLLTISPVLLAALDASNQTVERKLSPESAQAMTVGRLPADEAAFRWLLNADPMATEKLAQGIRAFAADVESLEDMIEAELLDEHAAGVERAF